MMKGFMQLKTPVDAVKDERGYVIEGTPAEADMSTWHGRMYSASVPNKNQAKNLREQGYAVFESDPGLNPGLLTAYAFTDFTRNRNVPKLPENIDPIKINRYEGKSLCIIL